MPDTVAPPRDWNLLAAWMEAEWKSWDRWGHPFHKGLYEAYSTIADIMRDGPPEQREDRLFAFLTTVLTSPTEGEELHEIGLGNEF